jgi:hypothetical protein
VIRSFLLLILLVFVVEAGSAQVSENIPLSDLWGSETQKIMRGASFSDAPTGLSLLPINFGSYYNSELPWGPNLGSVWLGKGYTQSLSGGFRFHSKYLDFQLNPLLLISENESFRNTEGLYNGFELIRYEYVKGNIDTPYRIDDMSFSRAFPGDSWVKLRFWDLAAGVSTENLWWGPSKRSSILMSNNAPGFLHATVHTTKPIDLWALDFETQMVVGKLEPSFSLDDYRRDYNVIFNGIVVSFSPRFDKNLKFGLIRTFILNENDISSDRGYIPMFQPFLKKNLPEGEGGGNDPDDQRASVFVSWAFPSIDFQLYGEYARDDHNTDLRDLYFEPNHIRAYTIGAQKQWENSIGKWSYTAELTQLETTNTKVVRFFEIFYTHTRVQRGYTNNGQYLGSHYGRGGNGWYMSLMRQQGDLTLGAMVERVSRDKDFYTWIREFSRRAMPETEMVLGLMSWYDFGQFRLGAEVNFIHTRHRHHVEYRDENNRPFYFNPKNMNVQVTVAYRPEWGWSW